MDNVEKGGRESGAEADTGLDEDVGEVEDDGVDPRELLVGHHGQHDEERVKILRFAKEFLEGYGACRFLFLKCDPSA